MYGTVMVVPMEGEVPSASMHALLAPVTSKLGRKSMVGVLKSSGGTSLYMSTGGIAASPEEAIRKSGVYAMDAASLMRMRVPSTTEHSFYAGHPDRVRRPIAIPSHHAVVKWSDSGLDSFVGDVCHLPVYTRGVWKEPTAIKICVPNQRVYAYHPHEATFVGSHMGDIASDSRRVLGVMRDSVVGSMPRRIPTMIATPPAEKVEQTWDVDHVMFSGEDWQS
jgi:hypothetical protein